MTGESYLVARARRAGVTDERILATLGSLSRVDFVPPAYADIADADEPIPTLNGQVTSQPSLIALMVQALEVGPNDRVLEIGTGFGFQTAILGALAGDVVSIERDPDIADAARANLARGAYANVSVVTGDGTKGFPSRAPYDAVIVSAAFPSVPPPLGEQLAAGGRLVQPLGPGGRESVVLFRREGDELVAVRAISGARFVRLVGDHAFPR